MDSSTLIATLDFGACKHANRVNICSECCAALRKVLVEFDKLATELERLKQCDSSK